MIDFVFDKIICLPLHLTDESRFKIIRVAGILSMFVWLVVAIPFLLIMPFLMLAEILSEA